MQSFLAPAGRLPAVRRIEAVGFRAWPASSIRFDGSWQVRITAGHPSQRLNCVVPLDPGDDRNALVRLERIGADFRDAGRRMVLRETPLASTGLIDSLSAAGWQRRESYSVMTADLAGMVLPDTMDHLPLHDAERFAAASLSVKAEAGVTQQVMADILSRIEPQTGYFVLEQVGTGPLATVLAVQDADMAGILGMNVRQEVRRQGLGRELLTSALRWARLRGAKIAWLQCRSDNDAALGLYHGFGFSELYRYHYWEPAHG